MSPCLPSAMSNGRRHGFLWIYPSFVVIVVVAFLIVVIVIVAAIFFIAAIVVTLMIVAIIAVAYMIVGSPTTPKALTYNNKNSSRSQKFVEDRNADFPHLHTRSVVFLSQILKILVAKNYMEANSTDPWGWPLWDLSLQENAVQINRKSTNCCYFQQI